MVKEILDAIEDVAEELRLEGIDVPSVVVCGNQSSGKSSLLESLTGVQFPRGDGTVTRCPIIVRTKTKPGSTWQGRIQPGGRIVENPAALCEEIARCQPTNVEGITEEPIHVEVTQSSGPELRLVDLPGIVQLRESAMHEKTVGLVEKYINNPCAVILVVTPATDDLETSRAIQLAQDADPCGERTLGVLTKVDHVREDTARKQHVINILSNSATSKNFELKLGYVAVRTRKGDEADLPLSVVGEREAEFFQSDGVFSTLPPSSFSVRTLKNKVSSVQALFLRRYKEKLVRDIKKRIESMERVLADLEEVPSRNDKVGLFVDFTGSVISEFQKRTTSPQFAEDTMMLCGEFNKIGKAFHEKIKARLILAANRLMDDSDRFEELEQQLQKLGSYSKWTCLSLFASKVRTLLVEPLKEDADEFVSQMTQLVHQVMREVVTKVEKHKLDRFLNVRENIFALIQDDIETHEQNARVYINRLLDAESAGASFDAFIEEDIMEPKRDFVSFLGTLGIEKRDLLLNAVQATVGPVGEAAFATLLAASPPIDRNKQANADTARGIVMELQLRAQYMSRLYGNALPRVVWTEQVSRMLEALKALQSRVAQESDLPDKIMLDDPELAKRQKEIAERLGKLRLAYERLHSINFEPEPAPTQ